MMSPTSGLPPLALLSFCLLSFALAHPGRADEEPLPSISLPTPPISLPTPQTDAGKPLMQALRERRSTKQYSPKAISQQHLSNLLWAAFGINRTESGKRTAASAFNCQDIDVYVIAKEAAYRYQADRHELVLVARGDLRSLAATQDYARVAAIQLVYVSDYRKMAGRVEDRTPIYAAFHSGSISQNVYLYCASAGLGAVVRDGVAREELHQALELHGDQIIVMAQTVGHPPETK